MKISVIDAFGTRIGEAEVTFIRAEAMEGLTVDEEMRQVMPASQRVLLPTFNQQLPFRLEVEV